MKPSTACDETKAIGAEGRGESAFVVGSRVERELDGLWFPATIVAVDASDGTFELEYDEDHNRETDISAGELRYALTRGSRTRVAGHNEVGVVLFADCMTRAERGRCRSSQCSRSSSARR